MFRSGNRRDGVSLIRIRVPPALALIFHVVGGLGCDFATVVTFDYAQREIDSGRKAAGRREISIFNEPRATLQLNLREVHRECSECSMKRGCAFAIQESGLGENERAGTDRYRDVGVLGCVTD